MSNASDFKISEDLLEKWTATRKEPQKLGSKFYHPRIFSTIGYNADRSWFVFALLIELFTIFISIVITGFNIIIVIGACIVVVADLVFAKLLHKPQKNINKYNCKLALTVYEGKMNLIDENDFNLKKKIYNLAITKLKRKKIIPIFFLIVIAILKMLIAFIAMVSFSMTLAYVVPVLFALTAYIHIMHTGYFWAETNWMWFGGFQGTFNNAERKFVEANAKNDKNLDDKITSETPLPLENIPESIKNELDKVIANIPPSERNKRRFNEKRERDDKSLNMVVFGLNHSLKLIYRANFDDYCLSSWGPIQDIDLFEFVNEAGMTDELRSFIGYYGLKEQKFTEDKL